MTDQVELNVHVIPAAASRRLMLTARNGAYLGSVTFDAINPQALATLGETFHAWCAEQTGKVQPVGAAALSGLRRP